MCSKMSYMNIVLQRIYKEIKEETEKDVHYKYGMFVLVLMSFGKRGDILLDCYGQDVDLIKIQDMLSPSQFPAMEGKPKLMIIQACSGGKLSLYNCTYKQ